MKWKRGGRRREGEEEKENGHETPLHVWPRFATAHSKSAPW